MLIRRILFFLFLLFTLTGMAKHAHSQSRPVPEKEKFYSVFSSRFEVKSAPDTMHLNQMLFALSSKEGTDTLYWAVSQMGAILLYGDSSGKFPFQLEKRRFFPFQRLLPGISYQLEVTVCSGRDALMGARLSNQKGQLVDEVFFCFPRQLVCFSKFVPIWVDWIRPK
jgi:hypothetical protein